MLGFPDNSKVWTRAAFSVEKDMATHSSIVAWRIPWTEEPGGPQPTGSQRVGHDLATSSSSSSLLWWDHWMGLEGCKAKVILASNCYFGLLSCQVTSQDKAPSVISRVLKKNNRDSAVASEYELVQLLPGERGQRLGGKTDSGGEGCPPVAVLPHPGGRAGMTALDTSLLNLQS